MAKASQSNKLGAWTFVIGGIVAIIFGFLGSITATVGWILMVIGLIVGLLNIADEEVQPFLMSGVVLIIAAAFGQSTVSVIPTASNILSALLFIFVPATIIVALKNVFSLAKH